MDEATTILSQLTTFEVIQLTYLQREAMFMNMTIFLTVLTGFLALAYLMSNKFDRTETALVSILYSAFSLFLIIDYSAYAFRVYLTQSYLEGSDLNPVAHSFISVMMFLSWAVSIWYMLRERRPNT